MVCETRKAFPAEPRVTFSSGRHPLRAQRLTHPSDETKLKRLRQFLPEKLSSSLKLETMYKTAIQLLVQNKVKEIEVLQSLGDASSVKRFSDYVEAAIAKLPWFYRWPVQMIGSVLTLFSFLSFKKTRQIPKIFENLPVFSGFFKLVGNLTLLVAFDQES